MTCGLGKLPWDQTENQLLLFKQILQKPIKVPAGTTLGLKALFEGLLNRTPSARFTFNEVETSIWFAGIDWEDLASKKHCTFHTPARASDMIQQWQEEKKTQKSSDKWSDFTTFSRADYRSPCRETNARLAVPAIWQQEVSSKSELLEHQTALRDQGSTNESQRMVQKGLDLLTVMTTGGHKNGLLREQVEEWATGNFAENIDLKYADDPTSTLQNRSGLVDPAMWAIWICNINGMLKKIECHLQGVNFIGKRTIRVRNVIEGKFRSDPRTVQKMAAFILKGAVSEKGPLNLEFCIEMFTEVTFDEDLNVTLIRSINNDAQMYAHLNYEKPKSCNEPNSLSEAELKAAREEVMTKVLTPYYFFDTVEVW